TAPQAALNILQESTAYMTLGIRSYPQTLLKKTVPVLNVVLAKTAELKANYDSATNWEVVHQCCASMCQRIQWYLSVVDVFEIPVRTFELEDPYDIEAKYKRPISDVGSFIFETDRWIHDFSKGKVDRWSSYNVWRLPFNIFR